MKITDIKIKPDLKIRRANWKGDYYWYYKYDDYFKGLVLMNCNGNNARICESDLTTDNWELYVEEIKEANGLRVGDIVRIVNEGGLYHRHHQMAKKMRLKKWTNGKEPMNTIGKVVAFRNHRLGFGMLCGVRIGHNDYIYGIDAVKKQKETTLSDNMNEYQRLRREDVKQSIKNIKEEIYNMKVLGYITRRNECDLKKIINDEFGGKLI